MPVLEHYFKGLQNDIVARDPPTPHVHDLGHARIVYCAINRTAFFFSFLPSYLGRTTVCMIRTAAYLYACTFLHAMLKTETPSRREAQRLSSTSCLLFPIKKMASRAFNEDFYVKPCHRRPTKLTSAPYSPFTYIHVSAHGSRACMCIVKRTRSAVNRPRFLLRSLQSW